MLLRPIVEDTLFPTVCYVCGPSELAYLAQLRKVYEKFGVPMPLFYPRSSATIVDSASARFLEKHELPFEALQARDESALNRLLAASLPESVDRALKEADAPSRNGWRRSWRRCPPSMRRSKGRRNRRWGNCSTTSTLRGKVIRPPRSATRRCGASSSAQAQAFPDGIPQERALSSVALLNRYGPALVERLVQELPLDPGHHWVLTL